MGAAEYNDPRLKFLLGRGALGALLLAAAIPALLLLVASLPWKAERAPAPPHVTRSAGGEGSLQAGAGEARFDFPVDPPIAGFTRWSYRSEGVREPVGARAVVLAVPGCKIALASAEILLVPDALRDAVLARVADLGLDGVIVAATHTHAGPGGYWQHGIAERLGTGRYDPRLRDAVASAIAEAIRAAAGALAPARVAVAGSTAPTLAKSRTGGLVDAHLTVVRLDHPDGSPVAELAIFPAHPTILGKENRRISGDWPHRFLAGGSHGLRVFFQGALGDQSVTGSSGGTTEMYGAAFSARVDSLRFGPPEPSAALAFAAVDVGLPSPDPGAAPPFLRRAARNLSRDALPAAARVEVVRLGGTTLVAVPAEPVAAVAAAWRAQLPTGAEIVSLANGYLGYVEEPERMAAGAGETVRTYFGPDLASRLGEAARAGADVVTSRREEVFGGARR